MKNNLGKHLLHTVTRNLGYKLVALFFSLVLWFVVNNITDPADSKSFTNIPVEIVNADKISNEGKFFEVLDGSDSISVRVKGKTSVLKNISKEDIKAVADLSELTFMNTVNIKVSSTRNNSELEFVLSNENLKLSIEDIRRTQFPISAKASGQPAEGYIVGNVTPSQNVVRVSGPESLIDLIDHVEANANIGNNGYTSDINTSVDLQFFTAEGEEIKDSAIQSNISTINVAISILATKEVPVTYVVTGTPETGYMLTDHIESDVEQIMIAGKKSVVDSVSEIVVSDEGLNANDKDKDFTAAIPMKKYLPTGIQFADASFSGTANVTVQVRKIITKTYDVPKRNFAIDQIPDGFDARITYFDQEGTETFPIAILGTQDEVNAIRERDIIGVIDLGKFASDNQIDEWADGVYTVDVIFNVAKDHRMADTYKMNIEIKHKE